MIHAAKAPVAALVLFVMSKRRKPGSKRFLTLLRFSLDIQLDPDELYEIFEELSTRRPCKLLVFGVGYDSIVWARFNKGGETVFLEDNEYWMRLIKRRYPLLNCYKVRYFTRRTQFRDYVKAMSELQLRLPSELLDQEWQVVIVDGPAGAFDHEPGRMQSIFAASMLVARSGVVFVHDVDRPIENLYSKICFEETTVASQVGRLRTHRIGEL